MPFSRIKPTIRQFFLLIFVLFIFQLPAHAQTDITGEWRGAIKIPGTELAITIDFGKEGENAWKGSIDIPAQGAKDLPLAKIVVDGKAIAFDLPNVPGNPTFKGEVSVDGQSISGDFSQAGQTFPFELKKVSAADQAEAAASLEEKLTLIRAFTDSTRKIWNVPAIAISIVKDNKVVFAEGFGLRNIEKNLPADENTLFAIGSCSKAFTTMILGFLAEEGKIDWNEPVKTYLPTFKLHDEFATARMTPRDLVTHNSGLPRHDLMWYGSPLTREQLFDRLQYLEPNKDFRTTYQYQNLMFMTAGYLAGQVMGTSWENLVTERIFEPLGMTNSNFSVEDSKKSDNHSLPYVEKNDKIEFTPFRNIDEVGPAGSINSSVADMAKWMRFHLNKGKVGDKALISESNFEMMQTPYTAISSPQQEDEISHASYGLGWLIQYYRGHKRVSHGGGIDGFTAQVGLLPRDNIGIVVLTNRGGTPLPGIVSNYASDLLLDLEPVDWNSRIKSRVDKAKEEQKKQGEKKDEQRIAGTKPSHPLSDFAGEYEHPAYGVIAISQESKQLSAKFNSFSSPLEHWHYDVFRMTSDDLNNMKITFYSNEKGDLDHLTMPLEAAVDPIVFKRKPSSNLTDPKFLSKLAGEYTLENGTVATVAMKGENEITVHLPGQPTYDLEPYKETTFNLKGLTGYSLKFVLDKNSRVTEAVFLQPNGTFPAKRK